MYQPGDPYPPASTYNLRASTHSFIESGTALLSHIEHLGNQAGAVPAGWYWHTDYDYRNPSPRPPILSGMITDHRPASARQAALQWANILGLTPKKSTSRGTVAYEGELDGLKIEIWTVVDRKAYGGTLSSLKYFAPDVILSALFALTATTTSILLARHRKQAKARTR
ncbi:MAG TPA: hypothetical protein VGL46_09680 [Pseudonocardiaceae bacterium]|jgi:hypothetical protein